MAHFNAELISEVHAALLRYKVVFFRNQVLTQAQHMAFASQFGELETHPATPEDQPNPNREGLCIKHGPNNKGKENIWHSDVTWHDCPSLGSILRALELPQVGGDTLFANMILAYERLSDAMKERIEGLVAVHDIAPTFSVRLNRHPDDLRAEFPPVEHPVVRTHPETKERLIYD